MMIQGDPPPGGDCCRFLPGLSTASVLSFTSLHSCTPRAESPVPGPPDPLLFPTMAAPASRHAPSPIRATAPLRLARALESREDTSSGMGLLLMSQGPDCGARSTHGAPAT